MLARARRAGGTAYRTRLAELERSATARIVQLTRPGPVLLDLAVRGFGVWLDNTVDNTVDNYSEENDA